MLTVISASLSSPRPIRDHVPDVTKKKKRKDAVTPGHAMSEGVVDGMREKPSGARGEHIPHDASGAEDPGLGKRYISDNDRRRLAREGKALVNADGHISYPIETTEDLHNAAHLARTGHGDVEAARRLIARRAKELGVPNPLEAEKHMSAYGNPADVPDFARRRLSEPVTAGHEAPSTGNHNLNAGRSRELAYNHPDMRQGSTTITPFANLRTANAEGSGDRDITWAAGRVQVQRLDARDYAGSYDGMNPVACHPYRPADHIARDSATPPNGTHSVGNATCPPRQSMKSSEMLDIMKRAMSGE